MPTPTKGPRLGSGPAHQRLMLANLATALFEHGRIVTTQAKAKRLRPVAERLITFAKQGDLPARRRVMTVIRDKSVVHELFTEIGPRFENRPGGYTRIVKLGPRKGDSAPMAVIELVEALDEQTTRSRSRRSAKRAAGAVRAPEKAASAGAVEEALAGDTDEAAPAVADETPDTGVDDAAETEASVEEAAAETPDATVDDEAQPVTEVDAS